MLSNQRKNNEHLNEIVYEIIDNLELVVEPNQEKDNLETFFVQSTDEEMKIFEGVMKDGLTEPALTESINFIDPSQKYETIKEPKSQCEDKKDIDNQGATETLVHLEQLNHQNTIKPEAEVTGSESFTDRLVGSDTENQKKEPEDDTRPESPIITLIQSEEEVNLVKTSTYIITEPREQGKSPNLTRNKNFKINDTSSLFADKSSAPINENHQERSDEIVKIWKTEDGEKNLKSNDFEKSMKRKGETTEDSRFDHIQSKQEISVIGQQAPASSQVSVNKENKSKTIDWTNYILLIGILIGKIFRKLFTRTNYGRSISVAWFLSYSACFNFDDEVSNVSPSKLVRASSNDVVQVKTINQKI